MPGNGPPPGGGSTRRDRVSWMIFWLVAASIVVMAALAAAGFDDDEGTVHEPAVDALADREVLAGTECGTDLICPRDRSAAGSWPCGSYGPSARGAHTLRRCAP